MQYFDDIQVGDKMVTRGRTITEADIVNFAGVSGDFHPLHTDVEYAKKGKFGERVAHGALVFTVASGLFPIYEFAMIGFYGIDRLRFIRPTKIGDTLHLELEVVDKQDKDKLNGVVSHKVSVKNQRGEDVIASVWKALIAKNISDENRKSD